MQVLFPHSAGLEVHKKTVVAAYISGSDEQGNLLFESRTFGTMTADLLEMSDWLQAAGISHIAMESTGEFWKPVYNILEGLFTLLVVNASHVKHVPGRKTDQKDAQWLCQLMTFGLLKASFIPPEGQRELREMTRARATMVKERTALVNRLQKTLATKDSGERQHQAGQRRYGRSRGVSKGYVGGNRCGTVCWRQSLRDRSSRPNWHRWPKVVFVPRWKT